MMIRTRCLRGLLLLSLGACTGPSPEPTLTPRRMDTGAAEHTVERRYDRPAAEIWNPLTLALQALDLRIETNRHDGLGGQLMARRATDEQVTVTVRGVDDRSSAVSVFVGPGDRNLADLVHSRLARQLDAAAVRTRFDGASRADQAYETSLARAVVAAEKACQETGVTVAHREMHDTWVELIGRKPPDQAVLLRFEVPPGPGEVRPPRDERPSADGGAPSDRSVRVQASFAVGLQRSEENDALLRRLKEDFERLLK